MAIRRLERDACEIPDDFTCLWMGGPRAMWRGRTYMSVLIRGRDQVKRITQSKSCH